MPSLSWEFIFEKSSYCAIFERELPLLLGITRKEFLILGGIRNNPSSGNIQRINVEKEQIREYEDVTNTLQFWYGKLGVFGEDSCIYLEGESAMLREPKFMGL